MFWRLPVITLDMVDEAVMNTKVIHVLSMYFNIVTTTFVETQYSTLYIPITDLLRLNSTPAIFWLYACRSCTYYILTIHLLELGPISAKLAIYLTAVSVIF